MALVTDNSIDSFLVDSHAKIANARDNKKVSEALAPYNYDLVRFDEGMLVHKTAMDLHQVKKTEFSEQLAATDAFLKAFTDADRIFMKDARIAEAAFRGNRAALDRTGLTGERSSTYTGWHGETHTFYTGMLQVEGYLGIVAKFGITAEMLTANQAIMQNVYRLKEVQLNESADAQAATKARDKALEALHLWIADLVVVARVALADNPQLLESLNIKVSP